jgi:hypothetical protein
MAESENLDDLSIDVVELEDEQGGKEEFAILDELEFEGRHICVMAPLFEVQALSEAEEVENPDLSVEIFEVTGDNEDDFTVVTDQEFLQRLLAKLAEENEGSNEGSEE